MPRGPWLLGVGLVVAVVVVVWTAPETPGRLGRGSPAPGFDLLDLDGRSQSLDDAAGRVRLINFWATWCKPCEDEMPAMENLYQQLAGEGFELIAISVDEDEEAVRQFQERLQLSFTILLDPQQEVAESYQTYRFPETFLIDGSGQIVERYVGPKPWDDEAYVQRVRRLLQEGRQARTGIPLWGSEGARG